MSDGWDSSGYDVIYLAGCAVNSINPDPERVSAMDLEAVYQASRNCGISALVWRVVKPFLPKDENLAKRWKEEDAKALERDIRFDRERSRLISFLEESGIWYMLLKGILIKEFYSEPYLREMVDNDILIDAGCLEEVRLWFLGQGYHEDEDTNRYVHTAFQKKPVYRFEIHTCLFGLRHDKLLREYYQDVKDRLIPDSQSSTARHFSDDDFCVYLTAHGYKHRENYGIGIRALLDCYVYLKEKKQMLDRDYIRRELTKLGLADYGERIWDLAWKLFVDPDRFLPENLNGEEQRLLEEFLLSGIYGTVKSRVVINIRNGEKEGTSAAVKLRYLWTRLFPSVEYMARYRPIFGRYRWLIPAGYVYRFFYECKNSHGEIRSEIKILNKM